MRLLEFLTVIPISNIEISFLLVASEENLLYVHQPQLPFLFHNQKGMDYQQSLQYQTNQSSVLRNPP